MERTATRSELVVFEPEIQERLRALVLRGKGSNLNELGLVHIKAIRNMQTRPDCVRLSDVAKYLQVRTYSDQALAGGGSYIFPFFFPSFSRVWVYCVCVCMYVCARDAINQNIHLTVDKMCACPSLSFFSSPAPTASIST